MGSSRRLVSVALLTCLGLTVPALGGSVGSVKSRLMQAQEMIEKNQKDDATEKIAEAEKFLDGLTDAEKAPLVKQIAEMRAKLGATVDPEVSGRIQRSIERYINFAEGDVESNPHSAENFLQQATEALNKDDAKKNLNPELRPKLQARIDALNVKIKGNNMSDESRRFAERIEHDASAAIDYVKSDPRFARTRIDEANDLLGSDEAHKKLDARTVQRLQGAIADAEAKFAAAIKADALQRATPTLTELEEKTKEDPFKGKDSYAAYKVTQEIGSLRSRTMYELSRLPEKDADRKSMETRVATVQKKIDAYDDAWAAANVEAAVVNRWKYTLSGSEGWEKESFTPGRAFERPRLENTQKVVRSTKLFLEEKEVIEAGKQKNLPQVTATIAEAKKTLADAQTKLDLAFNQWVDAAEKQPRPQGQTRFDIGSAKEMGHWVEDQLGDSKYKSTDLARAKKLDDRWLAELEAIRKQHEAALDKLTAEATANWPKISSSISAQEGLNTADVASAVGKTYRFSKIRNRTGWDFDGRYDLAMWIDGQPVAGMYDAKIRQAFDDASTQIGGIVEDHQDWDIIAVVQGKGSINQRYTTEIKDEHMNVLGKLEGNRPIECVVVKVIAVHAGCVAVKGN